MGSPLVGILQLDVKISIPRGLMTELCDHPAAYTSPRPAHLLLSVSLKQMYSANKCLWKRKQIFCFPNYSFHFSPHLKSQFCDALSEYFFMLERKTCFMDLLGAFSMVGSAELYFSHVMLGCFKVEHVSARGVKYLSSTSKCLFSLTIKMFFVFFPLVH